MKLETLKADHIAAMPPEQAEAVVEYLARTDAGAFLRLWRFWSHVYQDPPEGDWSIWLMMAGRGAGKTRAGAEWVNAEAASGRARRIGIIGETMQDARAVMVEGKSGILYPLRTEIRPDFKPALRRLTWKSGAVGELFSADDPDQLRGPEFDLVWADEFAKWRRPGHAFDMAQMGLRLGRHPRMLMTTTPRNIPELKMVLGEATTAVTRAVTADNARHLSPSFLKLVQARYGGSRLGRQELMGEILQDDETALWRRAWIDAARVSGVPALVRVVVAVDPPVTSSARSDACGIIVAGRDAAGEVYVLADRTVQGVSPATWAHRAAQAVKAYEAGAIVVEVNQGGDLVRDLMREACPLAPVRTTRASQSKRVRAEPVAVMYEQGRVHHVGSMPELEDEMCLFGSESQQGSPDRVDALVWAVNDLAPPRPLVMPRVRVV
jgi:phage terminase large subunit-like protein